MLSVMLSVTFCSVTLCATLCYVEVMLNVMLSVTLYCTVFRIASADFNQPPTSPLIIISGQGANVDFFANADDISQEGDETFTLTLSFNPGSALFPADSDAFVRNELTVIIADNTREHNT